MGSLGRWRRTEKGFVSALQEDWALPQILARPLSSLGAGDLHWFEVQIRCPDPDCHREATECLWKETKAQLCPEWPPFVGSVWTSETAFKFSALCLMG